MSDFPRPTFLEELVKESTLPHNIVARVQRFYDAQCEYLKAAGWQIQPPFGDYAYTHWTHPLLSGTDSHGLREEFDHDTALDYQMGQDANYF